MYRLNVCWKVGVGKSHEKETFMGLGNFFTPLKGFVTLLVFANRLEMQNTQKVTNTCGKYKSSASYAMHKRGTWVHSGKL